mmetsp:Transcript_34330/g.53642  ORF Transcript_34330/g.53642 Transcript_34330/m.53642 type:complete len:217 (+) Transcript_34330:112-762(+)
MLHTPASSESIPLFSTALPTSLPMSCSTEGRLVIQRPLYESAGFGWSDFPVVQQQAVFENFSSHYSQQPIDDDDDVVRDCAPMSGRDDLSTTSFDSLLSTSTSSSTDSLSSANSSNGRRVKFADNIKVRTHTIVLGDHPCCKSLPLELGWEYDESEAALLKQRRNGAVRRRPYLERKAMLKSISGMTDAEIKHIVTSKLRPVGPSSRSLNSLGYDL